MIWLWNASLTWFANLRLKTKLYISFGWMCLFTVLLGVVCLGGIERIMAVTDLERAALQTTDIPSQAPGSEAALHPRAAALRQTVQGVARQFQAVIVALLSMIVFLDLLMAWRLSHLISHPIEDACRVLESLSNRDLTVAATIESTDEVGEMGKALNRTIEHLHGVLLGLRDSAQTLDHAAAELGEKTALTSANCNRQSQLAQEVLRSTNLLADKGGEIARNSIETAEASRQSSQTASSGGEAMATASQTMAQVAESSSSIHELMVRLDGRSREIGKVVTAIRAISENTNLLALNAAIEAARAGEQGRGFAVVAGEVRRLAEHTRSATEEIAQMVESIQQETAATSAAVMESRDTIESGRASTEKAHEILTAIIHQASITGTLAEGTASAAEHQSAASQQIAGNAAQFAELASASHEASARTAATGQAIRASAAQLTKVVSQFRL